MAAYPNTTAEFAQRFSTNEACRDYLVKLRWSEELEYSNQQRRTSTMQGTILQDSHLPLKTWFQAMWYVCTHEKVSALRLQQHLELGSYRTAWLCLHKLRKAMAHSDRDKLSRKVEFDVAHVEVQKSQTKQKTSQEAIVAIVVAEKGMQIRLAHVPNFSDTNLLKALWSMVHKDETEITMRGFNFHSLLLPYGQAITSIGQKALHGPKLPLCQKVVSDLKLWLHKFPGSVSQKYVQDYLNEFAFRFNCPKATSTGKLFHQLIQNTLATEVLTYSDITQRNKVQGELS